MCVVALDHAVGLEAREDEGVHELLERHAVLEPERDGDGEAVHEAAEGRAFLVHVEEDLAQRAVLVLAGAEVDLVAAHHRLLRVAGAAIGQPMPLAQVLGHHPLRHALGHLLHVGRRRLFLVVAHGVEGLARAWSRRGRGRPP